MKKPVVSIELLYVKGRSVVGVGAERTIGGEIDGGRRNPRGNLGAASKHELGSFRIGISKEIVSRKLFFQITVDLVANGGRGCRAASREAPDLLETEARVLPRRNEDASVLYNMEDQINLRQDSAEPLILRGYVRLPSRLDIELHIEEAALDVEVSELLHEVSRRAIVFGV
jgi:hypothetical protein